MMSENMSQGQCPLPGADSTGHRHEVGFHYKAAIFEKRFLLDERQLCAAAFRRIVKSYSGTAVTVMADEPSQATGKIWKLNNLTGSSPLLFA